MLVSIIVLFALCWGPSLIDNVLIAFHKVDRLNYGHLKYIRMAFALMSYFNSCVNPIVYAFMSKNFRQSFKHALCPCSQRSKAWHNGATSDSGTTRIHWKTQFPSRNTVTNTCTVQTSTRFSNYYSGGDRGSTSTYAMVDSVGTDPMTVGLEDENMEMKHGVMNMGLHANDSNV